MADDGLIAAYLRELRFSVRSLPDSEDTVAEAEDHLLETVARLVAEGRSVVEAQAEAVARFGSAELIASVCLAESRRGAAVPTTKTRYAGLAALLAPILLAVGQWGNVTIEEGAGHGAAVVLLTMAAPAFVFGLWGLRVRHGGLGRMGRSALVLAFAAPLLAIPFSWAALYALVVYWAIACVAFAVKLLQASVLPVASLSFFAAGPIALLFHGLVAVAITIGGGDAGQLPDLMFQGPIAIGAAGFAAIGLHMFREAAVDTRAPREPLATT